MVLVVATLLAPLPSPMLEHARDGASFAALHSPSHLLALPSPHDTYTRTYAPLRHHLGPQDVVVAPHSRDVFDIASVTGARFISAPGTLGVEDLHERASAVAQYFWHGSSAGERSSIAARYHATKVLLPRSLFSLAPQLQAALGPPTHVDNRHALFEIRRT
jgi:hypothetical protein